MSQRTSRPDKNYFSSAADGYAYYSGTPEERAMGPEGAPISDGATFFPDKPQEWDAIFKTSGARNLHLTGMRVAQGRENALDANSRCADCSFEGDFGLGGGEGDQVITTKGGSKRITYSGTIWSRGRNADAVCSAWSDQSKELTTDIDYSGLKRADGKPVTFILSRCRRVKLPPRAKVLWVKSAGYEIYFWLKRAAVALNLLG